PARLPAANVVGAVRPRRGADAPRVGRARPVRAAQHGTAVPHLRAGRPADREPHNNRRPRARRNGRGRGIQKGNPVMTESTSTDIARVAAPTYSRWDMPTRQQYAMMLAGAKEILPAGLKANTPQETAARLFLALETGDMVGLHPMAAINGIDVIEGNPTISPQLALGLRSEERR